MAERSTTQGTPQERIALRKLQYKSRIGWKDKYRQRCAERLKASRELLVARFRQTDKDLSSTFEGPLSSSREEEVAETVQDVMTQEWERLRSEYDLPSIDSINRKRKASLLDGGGGRSTAKWLAMESTGTDDAGIESMQTPEIDVSLQSSIGVTATAEEEDLDAVLEIVDEITKELIREERADMVQYKEITHFNERDMYAALISPAGDGLVCPICRKNFLCQNLQVIYCPCGLNIDTADCVTLDFVRQQLAHGISLHSEHCAAVPDFSVDTVMLMQTLIMNCPVCDFLYIVL